MNNKVLYLSVIIILSISMVTFSASTDIKSEELIEGVFISDNHDYWNYSVYSDFTFVMSSLIYNDYFIPLREEYREKLIEYQSRTKFSPTSLSRLISSENWHVRTTGIYLTVKQGENSLLTIIRNSIKDENPAVRFNAIKALGELDKNLKPEFFLAIIKNTKENPYPRAAAISVLTPWIKKDIYQYIKNLPGISDPLDYWIAWSIGYLKITEGYPKLMKMLSSDDACVIQMSLESLEKIADAEVLTDRIEYWPHMEDNPVFSENAIVCLNLYDEIEKRSRYSTSTYIKNIGKDNVIKALKDKDFIIRRNTVKALTPDTARNFEKELYLLGVDDSWRVIFHALPLIASFKNEIAYKIIDRQLHNRRDNIRKKALESAVIHGSKKFYDNFLEGLKNTDTDIREASIEGLYNISNNAAIPNLKKAFAVESDQFLKFCIIRSLVKLGYKTQSERESIYYKICSGTLMKEDLENTETIKTFLLFYNSMRSYSDEQNSWIDKSLESISKLYSENKELGLYIAEHYTEFSEYEINVICFFYLRDYSINAAIPIMIKRFVSTKQPYYYFSNARFNLSQIAGIPESEVTKIVKIWPEVLKQAKTPDDYPVLIKTMLKKKKEK